MELTNAMRRMVASLDSPRVRHQEGLFKAEGTKCVLETLPYFRLESLFATDGWLSCAELPVSVRAKVVKVARKDIERMSSLSCAPDVIAVYRIPEHTLLPESLCGKLSLALDTIQDPGNLGTIMRTADWMGVDTLICSHDTVDVYNPKVVQSTMGAIARVKVHYVDLSDVLGALAGQLPVIGTFLDGSDIYASRLPENGIIVIGNEGRGISEAVERYVDMRLTIPSYPPHRMKVESLNAAMATGIVLAEFRRRMIQIHK